MPSDLKLESHEDLSQQSAQDGSTVYALLIALAKYKILFIALPTVAAIGASLFIALAEPAFTSTARLMPPQQTSATTALLGQIGGIVGAGAGLSGLKNPNDLYIGMLESRTIADHIIERLNLKERFGVDTADEARLQLDKLVKISNGKYGLISIQAEGPSAIFAADLANLYVDELIALAKTLSVSEAQSRRQFFEGQLNNAKNDLAEAETELRETQERTGMIKLDGQVQGLIARVAQLKAMISAKEVQLASMRTFATPENPDFLSLKQEIGSLNAQLDKLQKSNASREGDFAIPTGRIPRVANEYIQKLRSVKYYEAIFELLAKQYEVAKIDEAKESSLIQVLDRAIPPEVPSRPKKKLILATAVIGSLALAILVSTVLELLIQDKKKRKPEQLNELRRYTRFKEKSS